MRAYACSIKLARVVLSSENVNVFMFSMKVCWLRILFVIVLKASRKKDADMIALDRVCHAHVNRLDKTSERVTSFININVRLFNFWWSRSDRTRTAITHRRMRRLGMNVSLRRKRVREERSNGTVVLALLNVQTLYLLRY